MPSMPSDQWMPSCGGPVVVADHLVAADAGLEVDQHGDRHGQVTTATATPSASWNQGRRPFFGTTATTAAPMAGTSTSTVR